MSTTKKDAVVKVCRCIIKHPVTAEERAQVSKALEGARRMGDMVGITLTLAQLTSACPARS